MPPMKNGCSELKSELPHPRHTAVGNSRKTKLTSKFKKILIKINYSHTKKTDTFSSRF